MRGEGRRALVVGAGLGFDAEHLAALGFATTAFDVAPTAVAMARERVPGSAVDYRVADLLDLPREWDGAFDLVVEIITVQALPEELRAPATAAIASTVAPGGTLFVVSGIRDGAPEPGPPWPLTREQVEAFAAGGLELAALDRVPLPDAARGAALAGGAPPARRVARGGRGHHTRHGAADRGLRPVGDTQTAALVGRDGSIDWLCLPRFDSPACFAALLGDESHGRWLLAPAAEVTRTERRYRDGTLVLETDFHTAGGRAAGRRLDADPRRGARRGPRRALPGGPRHRAHGARPALRLRPRRALGAPGADGGLTAIAGPDAVHLIPGRPTRGRDLTTVAEFELEAGDEVPFVLTWYPSHEPEPLPVDGLAATEDTTQWWEEWSGARRASAAAMPTWSGAA